MLCDSAAHPVDLGVAGDGLVVRIDHDDLEVFVGGVLSNPVGVEDTQSLDSTSDTFLVKGKKYTRVKGNNALVKGKSALVKGKKRPSQRKKRPSQRKKRPSQKDNAS